MKLRNIILAAVAVTACSSAFAADTSPMAQGGTYVGLAGGWGSIDTDSQAMPFLESLDSTVSASTQSGGFSGRVYLGYLMSFNANSNWLFGPEIGYSYYHNSTYTADFTNEDIPVQNITQSGYGIDMLLNATYMFNSSFNVAIKPGFQYAFEKFSTPFVVSGDEEIANSLSMNTNSILPEVNVEANWQVMPDKPFFLGASYQYIWGNGKNNLDNFFNNGYISVSSRDMMALNLEYMFH